MIWYLGVKIEWDVCSAVAGVCGEADAQYVLLDSIL
jgi:hypothetical protein